MKRDPIGINPPAVVRKATRSLPECAIAANAGVKKSEASIIEIGQALLEAKAQLSHGDWYPWLTANFCGSHRTAARAMRAARASGVLVDGEVLDAFDVAIDCDSPQTTAISSVTAKLPQRQIGHVSDLKASEYVVYCRPCRTTGVQPNCPECAKVRAAKIGLFDPPHSQSEAATAAPESIPAASEEEVESELPDRVRAALDAVPAFRECVDQLAEVQAEVVRLRESPGGWHVPVELLGDMNRAMQDHIWQNRPEAVCDECHGKGCALCDSQGWLSATARRS